MPINNQLFVDPSPMFGDPTGGAQHYKAVGTPAAWARDQEPFVTIGRHEFYVGIR